MSIQIGDEKVELKAETQEDLDMVNLPFNYKTHHPILIDRESFEAIALRINLPQILKEPERKKGSPKFGTYLRVSGKPLADVLKLIILNPNWEGEGVHVRYTPPPEEEETPEEDQETETPEETA